MAWPDDLSQVSTDLPADEFTLVRFAIDHELVSWDVEGGSLYSSYGSYPFNFLGQVYVMDESFELITSINRKE
jgi:hypothetical protein